MRVRRTDAFIVALVLSQAPEVRLEDLKRHVGQEVVACGRAVAYDCDEASGELVLHLEKVEGGPAIVIPRQYWPDTRGRSITDRYLLTTVCGRGTVAKKEDRYRVTIQAPVALDATEPAPAPRPPFAPDALLACAEGVTMPKLLREVKPNYTGEAMRALVQGKMYLEAEVRQDGRVGDVRELSTLPLGLGAQAVAALKQWRFTPATLAGRPVPVVVMVEMSFKLK